MCWLGFKWHCWLRRTSLPGLPLLIFGQFSRYFPMCVSDCSCYSRSESSLRCSEIDSTLVSHPWVARACTPRYLLCMKLVGFTLLADAYFLYLRLLHFFLSSRTNGHFPVPLAFALDP